MSSFFNQAKIINVYYNKGDRKPYNINGKPIAYIGEESIGANEATTIRFYLGEDLDSSTAIIVAKRANGDTRLDICDKFGTGVDSYYELTLNAWYAEFKGKMTIVFKVYNGTVTFDSSEMPTEIVSTTGRIVVSDIFNLDVAYAPDASTLVPPFETEEYEDWFFALSTKLDKSSSITVTGALPTLTGGVYDDRYFYVENEGVGKLFYIDGSTAIEVVWGVGTIQLTPSGNGDVVTGLEAGKLYWSEDKGTIVGGLYDDQVVGIGDGFFWFVKASEAITKGDVVQFAGNVGGQIVVKKAVFAEITTQPDLLMGVAKHSIANGNKGYIIAIGRLDNINTSGFSTPILYLSTTTPGQLTSTKPTNGFKGSIAAIGRASTEGGSNGFLLVRPNFIKGINEATDVLITSLTNKDILRWNSTSGRWENNADLTDLETNLQDYKDDINDGTIIVGKAENDKDGNEFDATYLKKTTASDTYLTQANASSTYLTQANATATYIPLSQKSIPNGVATLGVDGRVLPSQLPGSIGEVLEYPTLLDFPEVGAAEKIFIAADTNKTYRWSGTQYVEISQSLALGETTETAFAGSRGVALETLTDNIVDGTQGLTDTRITNSAVGVVPVVVNAIASTTANLQQWQVNGTSQAVLNSTGTFFGIGIANRNSTNNAYLNLQNAGTTISRNIADANPSLIVNLANSSSTGNIANFQFASANKLEVTKDGFLNQNGVRLFHQPVNNSNTFFGNESGGTNTTGTSNSGFGRRSFLALTTGSNNVGVGVSSLRLTTTGSGNVAVGLSAGNTNTTGNTNTFIGNAAGFNDSQLATATNSTALGNGSYTDASNQMVFGNASVTQFKFDRNSNSESFFSNVNVGVNATGRYIDVMNGTADLQRLRLTTSGTNAVIIATRSSGAVPNMLFQIQATEAMRITAGSLIGINETSPTAQLQVKSGATTRVPLIVDTLASHTANLAEWRVNGTALNVMTSAGRLGIGTSAPATNLEVKSLTTGGNVTFRLQNDGTATGNQFIEFYRSGADYGQIYYRVGGGTGGGMFFSAPKTDGVISFLTGGTNETTNLRMRITSAGNVGIGTTAPQRLLSLVTNTNDEGIQIHRKSSTLNEYAVLGLRVSASDSANNLVELRGIRTEANGGSTFSVHTFNAGTQTSPERFRINEDGNVGIGTTSPGAKLEVNGNQKIKLQLFIDNSTNAGENAIVLDSGGSAEPFYVEADGDVYNQNGTYGTSSDVRIKENIVNARNYTKDLMKLRVVKYSLKEEKAKKPTHLGFVAQEFEQVFPNMVSTGKHGNINDFKSIKTSVLIPMLVKTIQELNARIVALEKGEPVPTEPIEPEEPVVETPAEPEKPAFEPITNFEYDENE
jgi:hypothetical protein